MDERGFSYIELLTSIFVFSCLILFSMSLHRSVSVGEAHSSMQWKAYWLLKERVESWKQGAGGEPSALADGRFKLFLDENQISAAITEGVFEIRWKEGNKEEVKRITAYRVDSALLNSSLP